MLKTLNISISFFLSLSSPFHPHMHARRHTTINYWHYEHLCVHNFLICWCVPTCLMGWNKLRVNFVFQKLWQQDDEGNGARVRRSDSTSRLELAAEAVQLPPPSSFGRKRLQLWNWLDSLDLWSSHFKVGQRPRIVTRCSHHTQLNTDTLPFKARTYRSISACLRH